MATTKPTYIFVDGSYYMFYRYHSLLTWWKNAHPDEPLEDPFQNEIFVTKFKKTFNENLRAIPKNLHLNKSEEYTMIVGKDCKRPDIWRTALFPEYKATRLNGVEHGFMGGPFFKMVHEEGLFLQSGAHQVIKHPHLEADDCIALYVKRLLEQHTDCNIYIITSDKDYLQLAEPRVHLYNLSYKRLTDQKSCTGNPRCDLFCKIVTGDISDNIPSVFPKCGPKTALKYFADEQVFNAKLDESPQYRQQYTLNKTIIDFNEIPVELANEFYSSLSLSL